MIPFGPAFNAGAAADAFDVVFLCTVLGVIGIAIAVDVAALVGWLKRKP